MKVSIIVPIYNAEKFLNKCIESIINQTYKDLEIILIDDGSTDKSREICNKYKEKDSRIKVILQKNSGVSAARNAGIKDATGEYIGFVDSDDFIEPEMYYILSNLIYKYSCDIAVSGYLNIYPTHKIESDNIDKISLMNSEKLLEEVLMGSIKGFLWNKLFKAELFDNITIPEDMHYGEDLFTVANILQKYNYVQCVYTSRSLYNYVQVSSSITNDISRNFYTDGSLKFEKPLESIKYLFLKNEKIVDYVNIAIAQSFLYFFRLALLNGYNKNEQSEHYLYIKRKLVNNCSHYIKSKNIKVKHKCLYVLAIVSPRLFLLIHKYKNKEVKLYE